MEKMKKIAIDTSSLREIIETDRIYVDKTRYCLDMINMGKYFFLSRPRRFGKSLLIDTMENIFRGNKELFRDTYIYDRYDFESYPVIRLNMIYVNEHDREHVRFQMSNMIRKIGEEYGVLKGFDNPMYSPSDLFSELIDAVSRKEGRPVAVLIDEYDYPLMENIHNASYDEIKG